LFAKLDDRNPTVPSQYRELSEQELIEVIHKTRQCRHSSMRAEPLDYRREWNGYEVEFTVRTFAELPDQHLDLWYLKASRDPLARTQARRK
jgi:hypothetical protein